MWLYKVFRGFQEVRLFKHDAIFKKMYVQPKATSTRFVVTFGLPDITHLWHIGI